MLKTLLGCGAAAACLIGSAQPAHAAPTTCWYRGTDHAYGQSIEAYDCDIEKRVIDGVIWWYITDYDGTAKVALYYDQDTYERTRSVIHWPDGRREDAQWWKDSDGDEVIGRPGIWWWAFTLPETSAAPTYEPPTWDAPSPVRGGGLSSGEFSDRPFRF